MLSHAVMHRQLVESSRDGIWVIDPDGRTLFANDRTGELLGRSTQELARLRVTDVLDEEGRDQFDRHLDELRVSGPNEVDVECRYRRPDGSTVALLVGESALHDEDGSLIGYVHRLNEDSRRLAVLDELRRSRSQLAEAQAIARLGSWEIDLVRGTVSWSQELYRITGLDPATCTPSVEAFIDLLLEPDRERVLAEYELAQRLPGERMIDAQLRRPDGTVRWVRTVGQTLERDPEGGCVRIGGTVQDINDLKQVELQLRDAVELNTLMQFMATSANEASTLHDAMISLRGLLLSHPDWQRAVAFSADAGGPSPLPLDEGDPVADDRSPVERRVAERALAERGPVFEEDAYPQAPLIGFPVMLDDEPVAVVVATARSPFERHVMLRALAGQIAGQLGQVAAREEVARELAAARDAAMEASRAKSEFLATMSHEIRTPMNGVIGLNDLLLRTELDDRQRQLARGMQGAGQALLALINDILDFSKIEAGQLELERADFDLRELVRGTLALLRPTAAAKGIALELTVDDAVPARLVGDPIRFAQVLTNIAANAVKFTQDGAVSVRVQPAADADADADGGVTLRTQVIDTGIGMDAQQRARIFEPFRQADASTTRRFGGTGLGLAIATRLAGALGGELGVDSVPGQGSTFWFTARFAPGNTAEAPAPSGELDAAPRGGRVLVVEDNEVNQLVAQGMLEELGFTVDVAADGEAGVRAALATSYDAVLMDLQMPRVDGYAATRRLREAEPAGRRVPVIALTASATEDELEHCVRAGMDGFLAKPITLARLHKVLAEHLPATPDGPGASASEAEERDEPAVDGGAPGDPGGDQEPVVLDTGRLEELARMGAAAAPLIRRAVDNFLLESADTVARLRDQAALADAEALRLSAHRVRGAALNLGALRLAELAWQIELAAEERRLDDVGRLIERLRAAQSDTADALRSHTFAVAG